jgi:hypothetical protein
VQVAPIKPTSKTPGTKRLRLKCDDPLSHFAFNFHLRRYAMELAGLKTLADKLTPAEGAAELDPGVTVEALCAALAGLASVGPPMCILRHHHEFVLAYVASTGPLCIRRHQAFALAAVGLSPSCNQNATHAGAVTDQALHCILLGTLAFGQRGAQGGGDRGGGAPGGGQAGRD